MLAWVRLANRLRSLNTKNCFSDLEPRSRGGGGVLPYNSYTGMCRPTGSHFWDSDLKRGMIFQMHESFKIFSAILTIEQCHKNLPIFWNGVSLWLQIPYKTGSTFGGLGGTHPPKTYSSTPPPPPPRQRGSEDIHQSQNLNPTTSGFGNRTC